MLNGLSAGDLAGTSVHGGGDVNGDGLADTLVTNEDDPNGDNSGAAVVFGKKDTAAVELSAIAGTKDVINGICRRSSGVSVNHW